MSARLPTFWIKLGLAMALVAAGDVLLFEAEGLGANLGLFGLATVLAVALALPAIRLSKLASLALGLASSLAVLQIERATVVGWLGFLLAMGVAVLAPRAGRGDDGWRWLQRLVVAGLKSIVGPIQDLAEVLKARARKGPVRIAIALVGAVLPVVGGAVFLSLFAAANPVIGQAFSVLSLPELDVGRIAFWLVLSVPVWALLRPRGVRRTLATPAFDRALDLPGVTTASIAVSLAVFNVVFLLQNGLDLVFLWSGAGLPKGVTFADYAHRGAYPLIATALLAGLFVLVFLQPGSPTSRDRSVRNLVVIWVAQNLFLVASTALRTLDYIEAYSLTRTRIAALLWMGLVAVGLVLICWRMLRGKSSSWLINTNLLAAGLVLGGCCVVDLGAVAAAWNVRHARDAGGQGVALDLCYMRSLKGAALVSLAKLEMSAVPPDFQDRVRYTRRVIQAEVADKQAHWRTWRWRDARRLQWTWLTTYETPRWPDRRGRDCSGLYTPPAVAKPAPPLTPTPNPGT
ncbi:DUF4153 domain-containing protein [Phenylobacterium sp.]|uniref:DUF4153 domain-containing protein n=1 Tax=Phenylobacterium sp. TaxID=1871053 RepID=UPI0025E70DDB|nr:DUF4173 domain-containing protein [Phenylobacterium sp.]